MRTLSGVFAAAVVLAVGSAAQAVVVAPGDNANIFGTNVGLRPELAGTVIEDTLVDFNTTIGGMSGQVQTRVVRSTLDGTLDFYYRILPDPAQKTALAIRRLQVTGFAGFTTDMDFRTDGLGDSGPDVAGSAAFPNEGILTFAYQDDFIDKDSTSLFIFVKTNALYYTTATGTVQSNLPEAFDVSNAFTIYAPSDTPSDIPEPASLSVMAAGAAALLMRRRR